MAHIFLSDDEVETGKIVYEKVSEGGEEKMVISFEDQSKKCKKPSDIVPSSKSASATVWKEVEQLIEGYDVFNPHEVKKKVLHLDIDNVAKVKGAGKPGVLYAKTEIQFVNKSSNSEAKRQIQAGDDEKTLTCVYYPVLEGNGLNQDQKNTCAAVVRNALKQYAEKVKLVMAIESNDQKVKKYPPRIFLDYDENRKIYVNNHV